MTRDDALTYVNRDWAAVARMKAREWRRRKRSPSEDLAVADALRQHTQGLRPDWPSRFDRAADHESHRRVSKALRAVAVRSR